MNASNVSFLNVYHPTEEEMTSCAANDSRDSVDPGSAYLSLRQVEEEFIPAYHVDNFYWPQSSLKLQSALPNALRDIVNAVDESLKQNRRIVGFVSQTPGAGATTLLLAVARFLKGGPLRTLLVDANAANPQLAARLNMDPEFGWDDALNEKIALEEAVIEAGNGNVNLLPWLKSYSDDSFTVQDLMAHAGESLQGVRNAFDLILVDCSQTQIEEYDWLESVIVVCDKRRSNPDDNRKLQSFCRECELRKIPVLGTIENFAADNE